MRDRLEGVCVFVEAVEAGGFARAADRLALSRSAVGKSIARLEARLGVRLFHRTTRVQTLTEDGQAYFERCLRALQELRAGEDLLDVGRNEVAGLLRVSMPSLYGRYRVAPVLLDLARQYPKLELDLRFSDSIVDVIGEGYDLVIRNGPTEVGSGLRTRKLVCQRKIVCAAPSYLSANGIPTSLGDLSAHETLVYVRNSHLYPWQFQDQSGRLHDCGIRSRLRFDSLDAIVDAAVSGMGIAFVPDWLIDAHLIDGRLIAILRDRESPAVDTFAVWPGAQLISRRLRLTIDTLAAELPRP